ncbi:ParB/RepB/Spo0J family partition protein [Galactobacter valiniphilus]|uniref:ParB/RepB/Spo0J family partition protein n=1 Tax=Galactobacter valiniphilus TaxID=2676122 RepID=A0A399J9Y3_9MICC|nr:ParB/RepB/Spo0J family partition protein [Galactobacter valiniphilus]RII42348.1 ParB/RepB/Spo0J family partition protein [Galactobacter valiniphilus]
MAEKRRGLGRGLGALIANSPAEPEAKASEPAAPATSKPTKQVSSPAPVRRSAPAVKKPSSDSARQSVADDVVKRAPKSTAAPRKARPADMFFTATADRSRPRQSVPDVLGKASKASAPAEPVQPVEDAAAPANELVVVPGASFAEVPLADIHPNRKQPRSVFDQDELDELVASISEVGLLQPIVVRPSREAEGPKYELVMGERRWRASKLAGLTAIPAIVRDTEDGDLLRDALLENLHRSQLNPLEEAAAYQQLMTEFECTQEELSARIGRSRPQISNTIRLMRLPALVQRRVAAGVLSAGHARALLGLEDPAEMEKLAQRIVAEGLSVRATEEQVSLTQGEKPQATRRRRAEPERHERLDFLASTLQDRFDTNVKITLGARKGKVQIEFASVDDLNRIMALMSPED